MLAAGACGPRAGHAPVASDRAVTLAVRADVTGFFPNPPYTNEAYSNLVNSNIFEGPVAYDGAFVLKPALCDRWENPDDHTYRLRLREGARFSDGRPVTSADVAASLLAPGRRRWATRVYLQAIESARALDDRWVEIRTRKPDLVLLTRLPWGFVVPAEAASGNVKAVGTGPYALASWTPGQEFVLEANPHFRGPRPAFSRVRFMVVPAEAERVQAVLRGGADLADQVTGGNAEMLRGRRDVRVVVRQGTRVMFLVLRADVPPFDDSRVRKAVSLALDRRGLVGKALEGYGQPASQLVPPLVSGFNPRIAVPGPNLPEARRLLAESGHARGLELRLDGTNNRYPRDVEILDEVARQLAAVGIRVRKNALDKREFFPLIDAGGSPFHLLGYACEAGDAGDALDQLAHSRSGEVLGSYNSGGLRDARLDQLIDAGNGTASSQDRTRSLQDALQRLSELDVYVPLAIPDEIMLVSRRIAWEPPLNFALRPADMRPAAPGVPVGGG
jgi:peptide/nickel transport system substrate-binding protein